MASKTPIFPKKLPGSFWGITTFFNPVGYKNKIENYKKFRESSKKQGLNLLVVELSFGERPFELKKEDSDILIQVRIEENNIMWQKEAMLNIGLKNLPEDCDKVAWFDCDIIFENKNWLKETCGLLEKYNAVQPWTRCFRLISNLENFFYKYYLLKPIYEEKQDGLASKISKNGFENDDKKYYGETGFAFALRREILEKDGFYDKDVIMGSGDNLLAFACYGKFDKLNRFIKIKKNDNDIINWKSEIFKKAKNSVYYTNGNILHLWHGFITHRKYNKRYDILVKNGFDQQKDIRKNKDGLWEWNSDKPNMHNEMKKLFLLRKEDRPPFSFKNKWKQFSYMVSYKIILPADRNIGKLGIYLRKKLPGFYSGLKRIEGNKLANFLHGKRNKKIKPIKK